MDFTLSFCNLVSEYNKSWWDFAYFQLNPHYLILRIHSLLDSYIHWFVEVLLSHQCE